jgi:hypothetical protein
VYQIDLWENVGIYYESKISSMPLNMPKDINGTSGLVTLEVKYPTLEAVYEKSFLTLDYVSFNFITFHIIDST